MADDDTTQSAPVRLRKRHKSPVNLARELAWATAISAVIFAAIVVLVLLWPS